MKSLAVVRFQRSLATTPPPEGRHGTGNTNARCALEMIVMQQQEFVHDVLKTVHGRP